MVDIPRKKRRGTMPPRRSRRAIAPVGQTSPALLLDASTGEFDPILLSTVLTEMQQNIEELARLINEIEIPAPVEVAAAPVVVKQEPVIQPHRKPERREVLIEDGDTPETTPVVPANKNQAHLTITTDDDHYYLWMYEGITEEWRIIGCLVIGTDYTGETPENTIYQVLPIDTPRLGTSRFSAPIDHQHRGAMYSQYPNTPPSGVGGYGVIYKDSSDRVWLNDICITHFTT